MLIAGVNEQPRFAICEGFFDPGPAECNAGQSESLRLAHNHPESFGVAARRLDARHGEYAGLLHPTPDFTMRLHARECPKAQPAASLGLKGGSQWAVADYHQPCVWTAQLYGDHGSDEMDTTLVLDETADEENNRLLA